jgi:enoyl-CoA hydratase
MLAASSVCRSSALVCEKRGDIAYIIVNRPDGLNAIDASMRIDLCRAFKAARNDRDIRGIVLSGAGGEARIGPDPGGSPDRHSFVAVASSRMMQTLHSLIETLGKPVATAISGVAVGCGCEIAMACTLRIATDTARFGLSETRGRPIEDETLDAYEAYDIGLVDEIVPPAELIGRAAAVVREVATWAPAAARYASEAARRGLGARFALGGRFAKPVSTRASIADGYGLLSVWMSNRLESIPLTQGRRAG